MLRVVFPGDTVTACAILLSQLRVGLSVCALMFAVATAQPAQSQDLSSPDPSTDQALRRLQAILRKSAGPSDNARHDAYLLLITLANKETVPLLLERLRIDYGPTEPVPPAGKQFGFVCTHVHLVDALRSTTNTDQGMFYPRWKSWWDTHQNLTRLQWILEGFKEGGLHVIDPPDEQFGLELIRALTDRREYYSLNALRLLRRSSTSGRRAWVRSAASSDQRELRLGALRDLERIDTSGNLELIRTLSGDEDQEIRELADQLLKQRAVRLRVK